MINIQKQGKILIPIFILLIALIIRFYNFAERVNFGPEQAMSLVVSGNYIKEKPKLLGQRYFRTTTSGHDLFASALFSYSLVPLQLLFNFDPLPITGYFALLNLLTGVIIFLVAKKIFNFAVAIFSLLLFLFNTVMVYHSMFIWILNYLPLIGILTIYSLYKFNSRHRANTVFCLGLLSGIGIGLEYLYFFTAIIVLMFLVIFSLKKLKDIVIFLMGGVIGNLPMILFDLKHDFYHLKTLWQYFLETLSNIGQNGIMYYHFLQFWPLLTILGGVLLYLIYKKYPVLSYLLIIFYLIINLSSDKISFTQAVGMNKDLTLDKIHKSAQIIASQQPKDFNVAALLDFDSRAYPLRYLLKFRYNIEPLGVEEYKNPSSIYILAKSNYQFDNAIAWEITAYQPFKVEVLKNIDQNYTIYKLTKKL